MKISFFRLPENLAPQARNAFRVMLVFLGMTFAILGFFAFQIAQTPAWQLWVGVVEAVILIVLELVALALIRRGRHELGIWIVFTPFQIVLIVASLLISGLGWAFLISAVAITTLVANQTLSPRQSRVLIATGVAGGITTLVVDLFISIKRLALPGFGMFTLIMVGVFVLVYGYIIVRWFREASSLRIKIILALLTIEVISIGVLAYFALTRSSQIVTLISGKFENSVQAQTETQLTNTVKTEATKADQLFLATRDSLVKLADHRAQLESQKIILGQGAYWDALTKLSKFPEGQYGNSPSDIASITFPSTAILDDNVLADLNTSAFLDFAAPGVLNTQPQIVAVYYISTLGATTYYPNINLVSLIPADFDARTQPFYTIADPQNDPERIPRWTEPYQDPAGTGLIVTASAPVYTTNGIFKGVMGVDMQLARISESISQIKIGKTGFAFLVDRSGRILVMPSEGYTLFGLQPEEVPVNESPKETILGHGSEDLQAVTTRLASGESGLSTVVINGAETYIVFTPLNTPGYSLGVIVPVNELNATIVASRNEIQSETSSSLQTATFILIGLLVGAILLSLWIAQVIAAPIARLTQTAETIAGGDFNAQAKVESRDEIGTLATTFNSMTSQLRQLIGSLEQRVTERTHNLELAAEVGRTVSQVRALDVMLTDATELIRKQFDLYYVQVYLTDSSQGYLNLQAGTGWVGEQLLARSHRLPLDAGSINGRAAVEKKSVVISDTAATATFKSNPLLPNTHSEMAVPLLVGDRVVGVLDMQSEHAGSLNKDILPAFEALAGQLAIAIQNATFLAEAGQARAEVEAQARWQSRRNWAEYLDGIHKPEETGFVFEQNKIALLTQEEQAKGNALTAPIAVTGETLGKLVVEMEGESRIARSEELVNAIAGQVAQHIENLRLLESAERFRYEAEQASRRLTHEGWQEYMDANTAKGLSYLYDLKEVRPYDQDESEKIEEAALNLPLKVRDETIGKLVVQGIESSDEESVSLVNAIAERLGTHIEGLRLSMRTEQALAATKKQAQREQALHQITSAVRGSTDPTIILKTAARELGNLLGRKTVVHLTTADKDSSAATNEPVSHAEPLTADGGEK